MHILVVGGSGYLGGLVLPTLAQQHTLRVFDLRPPADAAWEYVAGSIGDFDALARAAVGVDALLYMAMGSPAVCSAIGANLEVIQSGENGLLASTPEEWISHIEKLIADPSLVRRLGAAGRKTVEDRYSMGHSAELFARVVRSVISSKPSKVSSQQSAVSAPESMDR